MDNKRDEIYTKYISTFKNSNINNNTDSMCAMSLELC